MVKLSKVEIIGAGPAGLYSAILLKSAQPSIQVRVTEQNSADATFGFGVVFSDQALDFLKADDAETHALITPLMERWQNMTLCLEGESVTLDGIGFAAIGRLQLLQLLQQRARELGVELRFDHALASLTELDADLIIGADGLHSMVRRDREDEFAPRIEYFSNHFAWFGTPRVFDTLTQSFLRSERGVLNAHHYRYSAAMSTFIVECDPASYNAYGFASMSEVESAKYCAELFADTLQGAPLIVNKSQWRQFPRLSCDNWVSGNRVILGDAAHTAHFSIGSGTRLALEDAIALAQEIKQHEHLDTALDAFQRYRQPIARKIVDAANHSAEWYEGFDEKMKLPLLEFAYSYLSRSGRVDIERLRSLTPEFIVRYEQYMKSTEG
ncbi:MAG: 2-polyprenyl-6-methoxyphenol hydroxylase-like FAD-dependent oxidoreductase [Planctomycetota bacterium]|jgi:2-polyprenyl-6-methoxyphenol hydroxylase-like FAD-dependent oxidoreductase